MSCDKPIYCSAIVDLASYPSLAIELGNYPAARETEIGCDQSLSLCRCGPIGDLSKSKAHIIPDSTQTVAEYVWGDEGPIND
jgi:hypothetical protein